MENEAEIDAAYGVKASEAPAGSGDLAARNMALPPIDHDLFHAMRMPSVRIDGAHVQVDGGCVRLTLTEKGGDADYLHAHARASVAMSREAAIGIATHILRVLGQIEAPNDAAVKSLADE